MRLKRLYLHKRFFNKNRAEISAYRFALNVALREDTPSNKSANKESATPIRRQ